MLGVLVLLPDGLAAFVGLAAFELLPRALGGDTSSSSDPTGCTRFRGTAREVPDRLSSDPSLSSVRSVITDSSGRIGDLTCLALGLTFSFADGEMVFVCLNSKSPVLVLPSAFRALLKSLRHFS